MGPLLGSPAIFFPEESEFDLFEFGGTLVQGQVLNFSGVGIRINGKPYSFSWIGKQCDI